jgi:polysaccharide biosynthesis transport protein
MHSPMNRRDEDMGPRRELQIVSDRMRPTVMDRGGAMTVWQEPPPSPWEARGPTFNLAQLWQIVVKHRLLIGSVLLVCLAAGAALTLLARPIYTAAVTVQIDREAAKVVDVQDVIPQEAMGAEEFYQTQYGLLRSRSLAEKVVDNLSLDKSPQALAALDLEAPAPSDGLSPAAAQREAREDMIKELQDNLKVSPVRGSRLVNISFSSGDPAFSAKVANGFADNFIASSLERRYESSAYARQFLEKRIAQVKTKLEETERQLVAYAADQQIITVQDETSPNSPGQSLDAASLSALNASLSMAKSERIKAEGRWHQAQANGGMGLPEVLQSPTVQQLSQARAMKQAEYQEKLRIYKPDYPAMVQLKTQIDETDRLIKAEAAVIRESVRSQYLSALNAERALSGQVSGLKGTVLDLRERSIQYNILQREVDTNRTLYDGLLQRYKEIGVAGGATNNNVSIVDRAQSPKVPSEPQPVRNMALAAIAGLGLGLMLALLIETLDQAVRRPADVENHLGMPVLGSVPLLMKGVTPREEMKDFRSAFWEAHHSIRTALQFSTPQGAPASLLVTSSRPSEGKSTTAATLAQSFARLGLRTLLIDADLRKPSLHNVLGVDGDVGLSNYLTRQMALHEVVQTTAAQNLSFVACGPLPPVPAELLAGDRLRELLGDATTLFDLVIFDGPPVMGLADAPMIGSIVAGAVLVIEAGKTGRNQAAGALRRLQMANCRMLGAVLTKFDAQKSSYGYGAGYAYDYDYSYGKPKKKAKAPVAAAG